MKKKKTKLLILVLVLLFLVVVVGGTYALWQITLRQSGTNVVSSGCFDISFTDANHITIGEAFPIVDEDGKKLTPYEFTITNNCANPASYQINLEILNSSTLAVENLQYIKAMINESTAITTAKILNTNPLVDVTLADANTSYKLETGYLKGNESKTYNLRLWLDENTPADDAIMNKSFNSKVTIITTFMSELPSESVLASDYFNNLDSDELIADGTADNNLRYVGSNPDNYVYFNCDDNDNPTADTCEKWRIIGLMNNIDDGSGNKESRLKIMRDGGIGAFSWGYKDSADTVDWYNSHVQEILNTGYYYNMTSGSVTNRDGLVNNVDFTENGFKQGAKDFTADAVWNIAGTSSTSSAVAGTWYDYERGTNKYSGNTSHVWTGRIALIYPSDYAFATTGGTTTDRNTCLTTPTYNWNNSGVSDCKDNNWMFSYATQKYLVDLDGMWTLNHNTFMKSVFNVESNGAIKNTAAGMSGIVPVTYLRSDVKIASGDGTSGSPFVLSLK